MQPQGPAVEAPTTGLGSVPSGAAFGTEGSAGQAGGEGEVSAGVCGGMARADLCSEQFCTPAGPHQESPKLRVALACIGDTSALVAPD